jgi:bacillithiol synthase
MTASMEFECISFREIPQTTKLFSTFLEDFERVKPYYAHPPTEAGIAEAAREVCLDPAVRRSVVEVLREQNTWSAPGGEIGPETARNLDRLAAGAVAIVTGQQVGLFSGPAYSFYKAISILRCAEDITRRGIEAVPIFWLATEDHDLAEVNHTFWSTRDGMVRYELPIREERAGWPAGEVALGGAIEEVVAKVIGGLNGEFAGEIGAAVRESYAPRETYGSAFGKLMARLFAGRGIIFVDPLDARLQRLAAPVYLRALEEADLMREALLARSKELEGASYHAQVKVTRETTLLFARVAGRREAVRSRNGGFVVGDMEFSTRQLLEAMKKEPQMFSPSALLRPIVQDTLLPTAAYFGGPAEIAYWAQAEVNYRRLLDRMPAILPRASFTIVEPQTARLLAQYDLGISDILAGAQHVRTKMELKSLPQALSSRFDATEAALREQFKTYEEPLAKLDSTLVEALHTTEAKTSARASSPGMSAR